MGKRIKMTYLLLGIGIGIIVASTLYSLYPQINYVDLSDDMIMERAKELGMVSLKESISVENVEKEAIDEKEIEEIQEIEEVQEHEEEIGEKEIVELEVEITVESGSSLTRVATKLYNANLIDSKDDFILFVKGKKLDKRIITGKYKIKPNSSYEDIIKILTERPN